MNFPFVFAGILGFLWGIQISLLGVEGRSFANEPGSASLTRVTHFAFLQNLGNPCGVSHALRTTDLRRRGYADSVAIPTSSPTEFYQSMVTATLLAIQKQQELENADPNFPECNGLYLKSLPVTPPLANMNVKELYQQVYQSGIFLAAHLHIMGLDRQMHNRRSQLNDENVIEDPNQLSSIVTLRCGNESDSFTLLVRELTMKIEDILCTLVGGSTAEERASYRVPYNSLLQTQIYRYHSSCSLLETRDCLLVKETKIVLANIAAKFNRLLVGTDSSQAQFDSNYLDLENSLV